MGDLSHYSVTNDYYIDPQAKSRNLRVKSRWHFPGVRAGLRRGQVDRLGFLVRFALIVQLLCPAQLAGFSAASAATPMPPQTHGSWSGTHMSQHTPTPVTLDL